MRNAQETEKYRKGKASLAEVLAGKHYKDQFVKVYGLNGMFSIYNKETARCIAGTHYEKVNEKPIIRIQSNSWYAPYLSRHFAGKGYYVDKTSSDSTNRLRGANKAYKKIERWTS